MVNMNNVLTKVVAAAGKDGAMKEDETMYDAMFANAGILDRKQYNTFVREMQINSVILNDAAFKSIARRTFKRK